MDIKPALVKELRERTGAGMMECKSALGGNRRATSTSRPSVLRKAGAAKADKKASRVAAEGRVAIRSDEQSGRHVVARGQLGNRLRREGRELPRVRRGRPSVVLSQRPASVEALLRATVDGRTIEELRLELVTKVGENIAVRRFDVVESRGIVGTYVHGMPHRRARRARGRQRRARARPRDADRLARAALRGGRGRAEGCSSTRSARSCAQRPTRKKPPEIVAKMVEGRLRKFVDEITLTGQVVRQGRTERVRDCARCKQGEGQGLSAVRGR